jgi:hypothetical protein
MEKLAQYIEEITNDLKVDDFNIKEVQMRLPARKHFWVARLIQAKIDRDKVINLKKKLKEQTVSKVLEESPVKLTINAANSAAEKHETIQKINIKIKELDMIIEYLERVEKIMSSMSFDLKNITEINKLEQL